MKALTSKHHLNAIQSNARPGVITLYDQLDAGLKYLQKHITLLPEPYACCILFWTVSAEGMDVCVFSVRKVTLEAAWREGSIRVRQWAWMRKLSTVELRIDWVHQVIALDQPRPTYCQGNAASAWALADDDLEHFELLPLTGQSAPGQVTSDVRLKAHAVRSPSTAGAPLSSLLSLQGLHICSTGRITALPRKPRLHRLAPRPSAPWLPYRPTVHLLAQQQQSEGHWTPGLGADHLGMTYALLLAQRQISDTESAYPLLLQATDRAIAYLKKNLDGLFARTDGASAVQAMGLLVLIRYMSIRPAGDAVGLLMHVKRLAKHLSGAMDMSSACVNPWISLALNAYQYHAIPVDTVRKSPQPALSPLRTRIFQTRSCFLSCIR